MLHHFASSPKLGLPVSLLGAGMVAAMVVGVSPAAQAASLVPQAEGEVNVGFASPLGGGSYLNLNPLIDSVTSLIDPSTGTKSRLFVDRSGTANTYGGIQFRSNDLGTSDASGDYWFRPVAMLANGTAPLMENGQLEVGTFEFKFKNTLSALTVNWFDTEYFNARAGVGTSYTVKYGDNTTETVFIPAGPNRNIQTTTLFNVSSITLNLGEKYGRTGDGVNFQVDVPEPSMILGLGALVAVGLVQRRRTSEE